MDLPVIPEMIERVARAIFTACGNNRRDSSAQNEPETPFWLEIARSAILAMREPTAAMNEAGDLAMGSEGAHDCEVREYDIWRAMVGEALGEPRAKSRYGE